MRLDLPSDAVVVIAGIPGAGKTTLIDRATDRLTTCVVDTEDLRRAGRLARPRMLRVGVHYLRIAGAIAGRRPAIIHSRGTRPPVRRAIALLARLRGRPVHLVLLVAAPDEARAGQRARGRIVGRREMRAHVKRFAALVAEDPRELAAREGWSDVHVLDRRQAAAVELLIAAPAAAVASPGALPAH